MKIKMQTLLLAPVRQSVNGKNQFTLLGYSYDAAGNVLADGSGSTACAGNAYTWNAEEEMTCALGSSYTYDGDGIRVKKTGGSATPTLYWGTGTLAESDTSGNLTSEYIFLNGKRIARRDVATSNVYYYFADELGSSNVVATAAGALENESDFYPFGGELPVTQNLTNQHYKFEGKERDPESASLAQPQGLDNFGARFDSSAMGRFMSPDWANSPEPVPYSKLGNPQTLNLYAFTLNNPESAPDMDGHVMSLEQYHESLWSTGHPDQLGNDIDYTVEPGGDGSPGQIAPSASPGASCLGCSGTGISAQQTQEQKAEVGYGETSGLLPARAAHAPKKNKNPYDPTTWDPASAEQLQDARENIIDISGRNGNVKRSTASNNPIEQEIWGANMDAAAKSNGILSGRYFFIRQEGKGKQHPSKSAGYGQGKPIRSYGPFRNVGGGDVPRGSRTYIDIYDK